MAIQKGTTVITPDGNQGRVRAVEAYYTGRPGRPPKVAAVQMKSRRGRGYTRTVREFWVADLRRAS
jgi:hypothetical protein